MPEDSKKNDKKNAKEQRKPRQRQAAKGEKKPEKAEEPRSSAPKVTVPQKPPVYEEPPPEFFKNLKRETDEILKITEEESSKYKKKEIQSNWSKYEVPIESYDEIDEQENLGADYEKLIEAPLSVGGHFQFKHEKSWDLNTIPSQYDKYFEINMEELNNALCTTPFFVRNEIEQSLFSETDIMTMNNRSTRYKQKYYKDKSYSTPETEAQAKILDSLRDNLKIEDGSSKNDETEAKSIETDHSDDIKFPSKVEIPKVDDKLSSATDISLEFKPEPVVNKIVTESPRKPPENHPIPAISSTPDEEVIHDDFIFGNTGKISDVEKIETNMPNLIDKPSTAVERKIVTAVESQTTVTPVQPAVAESPETKKNPVIESPEDLEKWLDDFLDG